MNNKGNIKVVAVQIIHDYIGDETAKMYKTFYEKQDEEKVLLSLQELLNEYVGEPRTKDIFTKIGLQGVHL